MWNTNKQTKQNQKSAVLQVKRKQTQKEAKVFPPREPVTAPLSPCSPNGSLGKPGSHNARENREPLGGELSNSSSTPFFFFFFIVVKCSFRSSTLKDSRDIPFLQKHQKLWQKENISGTISQGEMSLSLFSNLVNGLWDSKMGSKTFSPTKPGKKEDFFNFCRYLSLSLLSPELSLLEDRDCIPFIFMVSEMHCGDRGGAGLYKQRARFKSWLHLLPSKWHHLSKACFLTCHLDHELSSDFAKLLLHLNVWIIVSFLSSSTLGSAR